MEETAPERETELEYVERLSARGLVVVGGLCWVAATLADPHLFGDAGLAASVKTAVWPVLGTLVTLVAARTDERLAAVLLFGASAAVPVCGLLYGWGLAAWVAMACVLITPMVVAATLFLLAARAETRRSLPAE